MSTLRVTGVQGAGGTASTNNAELVVYGDGQTEGR